MRDEKRPGGVAAAESTLPLAPIAGDCFVVKSDAEEAEEVDELCVWDAESVPDLVVAVLKELRPSDCFCSCNRRLRISSS